MNSQSEILVKNASIETEYAEKSSIRLFTASIDTEFHPLIHSKSKLRQNYYAVLEYFVRQSVSDNDFINSRLDVIRRTLLSASSVDAITEVNKERIIRSIVNNPLKPWTGKYRYLLLCDIALILIDESLIQKAHSLLTKYLSIKQSKLLDTLRDNLLSDRQFTLQSAFIQSTFNQYLTNRKFQNCLETKIMVTANMSAGKSTLINALIGKVVSCMKSEASTANIHYIYDKAYEDGHTSELDGVLTMDADDKILMDYDERNSTGKIYVATHFSTFAVKKCCRVCFIDTPGVNSAINREHGKLTRKSLREETYDRLLYVLNASRLGTDEELRHLRFVSENISKDKVIFVLNKLDDFNSKDDSIDMSIGAVKADLLSLGFECPIICPISAYFALLIKKELNKVELTMDERDTFELFMRKFSKEEYDLSRYYSPTLIGKNETDNELAAMARRCGLYGLETILYGG